MHLIIHVFVNTYLTIDPVVSSLCYKTSASAGRVVLDGFLTYQSSTKYCGCTLTSSQNTTLIFRGLANLQPNYQGCGSSIRVESGGTSFIINCFVDGDIPVSPTQAVTLSFERPNYVYDSNYCMLLSTGKQTKIQIIMFNSISYDINGIILH